MVENFLYTDLQEDSKAAFDQAFEQKSGPLFFSFWIRSGIRNCWRPKKFHRKFVLRLSVGVFRAMETIYVIPMEMPMLVTNLTSLIILYALYSLILQCQLTVSKFHQRHYAHKCFIESEFSHGSDAKNTGLKCQRYEYESDPSAIPQAAIAQREVLV